MQPFLITIAAGLVLAFLFRGFRTRVVRDFEQGLLVRNGRLRRDLGPGVHRLLHPRSEIEVFDLREQTLTLSSQEVTTEDRVPIKASVALRYRINDPREARRAAADFRKDLYLATQIALREAVAGFELDGLLAGRSRVGETLGRALGAAGPRLGVEVVRAHVLDVIVRGELKRALGEVVKARAEARAKLERARGESAALRNLANAARLLRAHDGLFQLRLLETAQTAAHAERNTLVLGLRGDSWLAREGE